jgi:hypothetical protein
MTETSQNRANGRLLRFGAAAALVALVAGCGGREGVRSSLGITLQSPDAFNVYPRQPLQMPADFAQLPPPNPGAPSRLDPAPRAEAQAALGNAGAPAEPPSQAGAPTAGEQALLASAGADQADPNIRTDLAQAERDSESPYGLSSLFGYVVPDYDVQSEAAQPVLQSREEADRIRAEGGTTPNAPPPPPETPSNEWVFGEIF